MSLNIPCPRCGAPVACFHPRHRRKIKTMLACASCGARFGGPAAILRRKGARIGALGDTTPPFLAPRRSDAARNSAGFDRAQRGRLETL